MFIFDVRMFLMAQTIGMSRPEFVVRYHLIPQRARLHTQFSSSPYDCFSVKRQATSPLLFDTVSSMLPHAYVLSSLRMVATVTWPSTP